MIFKDAVLGFEERVMSLDIVEGSLLPVELKLLSLLKRLEESHGGELVLKMMILGHGRHGKDDTAALICAYFNLVYKSSSHIAMDEFLYDLISTLIPYESKEQCYDDRYNHRDFWHRAIATLNHVDAAALSKIIFSKAPIYCGIRSRKELLCAAVQKVFNVSIWVDAKDRKPLEPVTSNNIQTPPDYSSSNPDIIEVYIDNNKEGLENLRTSVATGLIQLLNDLV